MPPTPKNGSIAMERTIIPMPPNHWIMLLQKRIPSGRDSILLKIEAPVVVKPEIDSKYASVILPIEPERKKGREPKRPALIHPRVTMAMTSLWLREEVLLVFARKNMAIPLIDVIMNELSMEMELPSW